MTRRRMLLGVALGLSAAAGLLASAGGASPEAQRPPAPAVAGTLPAPQWVGATEARGRAQLTWVSNPAFFSVRIFRRAPDREPEFTRVGESRENSFVDAGVTPGTTYRYRLVGVGADGREGRASTELMVRIGVRKLVQPTPPEWEGYLAVGDGVGLKWGGREGEDIIAYNVYRKAPPDTESRLVGSSRGTSYFDPGLEPGRLYVYTVTALDSAFRETAPSAELPVKLLPPQPAAERLSKEPVWRVRRTRLVALVSGGGGLSLGRPADVVVGAVTGNVYLSDSSHNRIFVFSSEGVFHSLIGARPGEASHLKNALGLAADRDEQIYVVDAGSGVIQLFSSLGRPGRRIELPRPEGQGPTGFIDVAVGPDGRVLAVDNYNGRLTLIGHEGASRVIGQQGAKPGEFSAPTFCAVDRGGNLLVADCLNARIQVISASGEFIRSFGRAEYGPGGFGRPKGIVVGAKGEIYVADSWLNTVQVFDEEGHFVAVLGDEAGKPLDLGSPNGVALGEGNRIYIAERLAARLQIREILDEP